MKQIESAGLTDIGRKRKINQDAFFLDDRLGLYVVADGMGGHKAGEVAARMVVENLRDSMALPPSEDTMPLEDDSLSPMAGRLLEAIHVANRNVYRASLEDETLQGMGSTGSAVFLTDSTIIGANVGDSPIYLIHRNHINEISMAHTLEAQLAATGANENRKLDRAAHHILTQAIGTRETVDPYLCEIQCFPGDMVVIGSDGLSNKVAKEEINHAARSMPLPQACHHLVAMANERGGEDNITVLIARIGSAGFLNNPVIKPFIHFFRSAFAGFRNKR